VTQPFRSYNILVVEDNQEDAVLIREAFSDCGKACSLAFAKDTQQARNLLSSDNFDLVISDMGYRNDEGAEFIHAIRSDTRLKTLPIIVISRSLDSRVAYEAGANAFVAKSADTDGLSSKLRALMHFWMEVVELPRLPGT
jgi:CheY-like chemotaxis protein